MINEFFNTLFKVIHLRSVIGYNSLVFALKKTPLIGRLIPEKLYGAKLLKVIYWVIHVIKEVLKLFIGKILGLGIIYVISIFLKSEFVKLDLADGMSEGNLFASYALLMFICYALFGMVLNTPVFKCTTEKEYLVFMLRMNARKLNTTLFVYDIAKLFIGYLIAGIVAIIGGAPFWLWLGIPVLGVFIKLFGAGLFAFLFRRKNAKSKQMRMGGAFITVMCVIGCIAFPALFVFVANAYIVPLSVLLIVSGVLMLLGVWGLRQLKIFDSSLHRRALRDNVVKNEVVRREAESKANTDRFKKLSASGTVKGDKKGFEYLNALFVRRHRKMLIVKPVVFVLLVLTVMFLVIFGFIMSYKEEFGAENTIKMVSNNLINLVMLRPYSDDLRPFEAWSATEFFRWVIKYNLLGMIIPVAIADNSFKVTQAMYINCDNSLMTFSFFKKRDKIIKLFDIRVKQLVRFNLLPALSFGLFADLFLFYTGGQEYHLQYLVTLFIPGILSVIYSTTNLTLYYLFQPFTTTISVKSGAYAIARTIQAVFYCLIFWIPMPSPILLGVLSVLAVLVIFFARKLVYKFAPRTWKVKS